MINKNIRKVVKNGRNSYYINIPKEIIRELKIKERQPAFATSFAQGYGRSKKATAR